MTVRAETVEYRGYLIDITEWCGSWQPRPWPLASDLPLPSDALLVDATAPSLEAALTKARWLIDRLLTELPGILNWSIVGWQRLTERGHFVQPVSRGREILELLQGVTRESFKTSAGRGHSATFAEARAKNPRRLGPALRAHGSWRPSGRSTSSISEPRNPIARDRLRAAR